jgi:transcriptional regulator GlxA family with amidase domain
MSPMEFVAKTRLHHAAEMLRSTNMPVKVIAASIGFSSRSHFSRAFRDGYGADPSSYRRNVGQAAAAHSNMTVADYAEGVTTH